MIVRSLHLVVLGAALVCGCAGSSLWQTPRTITPSSYRIAEGGMARSVGRLRRLVLAPPRVHVVLAFFEGYSSAERTEAAAAQLQRYWEDESQRFLHDWRGYDVIMLSSEDHSAGRGLSPQESQKHLDTLAEWVGVAKDGEETPDRVTEAVRELARPLGVDGLVFIDGQWKASNITTSLMPLTVGLSTFFSSLEGGQRFHAYIFEAASGVLVWHRFGSRGSGQERFETGLFLPPREVLQPLEHAVPAALITD